jgi:tetratricopeptide (TPR) repeat protein
LAAEIALDPATPRRQLALALDTYNRHDYSAAEKWAGGVLTAGLAEDQLATARLVLGRSLINLDRPREALEVLSQIADSSRLAWLAVAARADAYVELHDADAAITESERAIELAPDVPEVRYHAARTAWHADRVWDALHDISLYRAERPNNLDGLLLHGSILGYIGSGKHSPGALRFAQRLFEKALPSGNCEAIRLYSLTAARLGQWEVAFVWAEKLLAHPGVGTSGKCQHTEEGTSHEHYVREHIVPDAIDGIEENNLEVTEKAIAEAERIFGGSEALSSRRALARGVAGDLQGALKAIGKTRDTVASAPAVDQIAIAAAFHSRNEFARAYEILKRVKDDLGRPYGLLRLAECAAATGELDEARNVLEQLADGDGFDADLARVALSILHADRATVRKLALVSMPEPGWSQAFTTETLGTPRQSSWEGKHHPTTPMLDAVFGKGYLN